MKGKQIIMIVGIIFGVLILIEVLALMKLAYSVKSHKSYWNNIINEPFEADDQMYVALGDSAAQGIGANKPQNGYVSLIAKELARKTNKNVHTVNLSVTGARLQDTIDVQLPKLKNLPVNDETVITLEIGANEMLNYDASKFRHKMDTLLSVMPKQTIVSDIPYFGGGRYRRLEPNVLQANRVITELAEKYNLRLAPLHQVTKQRNNLFSNSADFFHPSNSGYKNWFEAFRKALDL